jgi:hypothetical protein
MKANSSLVGAVASVLAMAGMASAQSYVTPSTGGGYGYNSGSGYGHHASTYEEGVLQGLASLTLARGEASYYHSLAAINAEEAYTRYLQNREKATDTYFRVRQINRSARGAERSPRLNYEQQVALAKRQAPDRLTEQQYDRTLGRLAWPAVLTGDEFAAERMALDRTFQVRSPADVGAATSFYGTVHRLTSSMEAKLKDQLGQLSSAEFLAGQKFLMGLAYESQQPLVMRGLAVNH